MRATSMLCSALILALPAPAAGQDLNLFTNVFNHFQGISLFTQGTASNSASPLFGAGTELLINLAPSTTHTPVVLGISASYLQGVQLDRPDVTLHGSVRSLPTLSTYIGRNKHKGVKPYVRFSFGLADLWNAQAFDTTGRRSTVKAQTFEYGGMVGAELTRFVFNGLFVEGGYIVRRFSSIDWGSTTTDQAQRGLPRTLDLSRAQLMIGFQFNIPEPGEKPRAPVPPPPPPRGGIWRLATVDDQKGPYIVQQHVVAQPDPSKSGSEKDELVDGTLSLDLDGQYDLTLFYRKSLLDAAGKTVGVSHLVPVLEHGVRLRRWGAELLQPVSSGASGEPYKLTRSGDTIMLRLTGTHHLLTFSKTG